MTKNNQPNGPLSLDTQIDEDRVRRALGLTSSGSVQQRPEQARQRHRFVTDGAVPVVMLNRTDSETSGLRDRVASAESALEHERSAHANTRRTLHDVQASFQALQTRFGHTELAHQEALKTERDARQTAEAALAALRAAPEPAAPVKPAPAKLAPASPVPTAAPIVERKPRHTRVATKPAREPKPVRWWTPTYRTKQTP